jgi:hypothetical protein
MPFSTEIRENRASITELKFLVPPGCVGALSDWARARLQPDPYGGGVFGDSYRTNSLYFDTRAFEVYRRRGSHGRAKYRIRRYGNATELFLERKLKTRDHVTKRRSIVALADAPRLASPDPHKGWAGHWFHRRVLARELGVVCQVQYDRTALVHTNGHGPIRMTLDSNVCSVPTGALSFRSLDGEPSLIGDHAILELKFCDSLPPVFEEMIRRFALGPRPISKYRTAVEFLRLAPAIQAQEAAL